MSLNHRGIIVSEGFPFIAAPGIITILLAYFDFPAATAFSFAATVFVTWFFRNPERRIPQGEAEVVSPADGKVIKIEDGKNSDIIPGAFVKVSIFMNVFNVHVNRIPCSGTVKLIRYKKGRFISANLDKASALNEQNALVISTDLKKEIMVVQIAGLIARRIVCWVSKGMRVEKGERFGLIRFGSRLDVYLPPEVSIRVRIGDRVKAGETVLGDLP